MRNWLRREAAAVCAFTVMKAIVTGLFFFVAHETALEALTFFVVPFVYAAAYGANKGQIVFLAFLLVIALLLWAAALLLSWVDLLRRNRKSDLPRRGMLWCFCLANGIDAICFLLSGLESFSVPKLLGFIISVAAVLLSRRWMKKPE